ncbi:MAG TPA: 4-hydroxythreonine-4-phosphate dehydrogenase PdxA [Spirochaetota bacterium]|nr:4-hydroxythreonine-4-phosphate dehydrogenase PdxA [Spirochaetota bacterium]
MSLSNPENVHRFIAITVGDPSGIGPEVTLRALDQINQTDFTTVVIGNYELLKNLSVSLGIKKPLKTVDNDFFHAPPDNLKDIFIYDIDSHLPIPTPRFPSVETGKESLAYIDKAIELWKKSYISGIVTGPVSKNLIEKTGIRFSGHTEYFAQMIGEDTPYMIMYSDKYSVILVTTHLPIKDLANHITKDKIIKTAIEAQRSMTLIRNKKPKIAICGLDPHCGDNGAIGSFDTSITSPLVQELQQNGMDISGPFAADTLFLPSEWEKYDIVIAHYHDQGLIPFKMMAFDTGVNVTTGLSLIRTSVDHGTAFNIAGQGIASFSSMIQAIKLCKSLIRNKSR